MDKNNFPNLSDKDYNEFKKKCRINYKKSSEDFAKHFKKEYGEYHELPPYWMLANLMDFGMFCTLFNGASHEIREKVANTLNVNVGILRSWLDTIRNVRNICAHHSRLWNRTIGSLKIPRTEYWNFLDNQNKRIYPILTVLRYCLKIGAPHTSWQKRFEKILYDFNDINIAKMGFPENWKTNSVWS